MSQSASHSSSPSQSLRYNKSFIRKIIYIALMVPVLMALALLGMPSAKKENGTATAGGKLSRLRSDLELSQAELGEIDPASESMRLASMGFNGVAAMLLWDKVNEYKKKHDYDKMNAAVKQLLKLEPNFVYVWEFQSHNLSYNVSVEFDDYRDRYLWVKKGFEFLTEGIEYNRKEPRLLWTIGWYFGQKIGRSDEQEQFRKLFREDRDFHDFLDNYVDMQQSAGPENRSPDNWKVSRLWHEKAQDLVANEQVPVRGKSELLFYSEAPMAMMYYAMAIEKEGYFGEIAQEAWREAGDMWREYGNRDIPTSWGHTIRLNDVEKLQAEIADLESQVDALAPGARERLKAEKLARLTEKEREAVETPEKDQTQEQMQLAYTLQDRVEVTWPEVLAEVPASKKKEADELVRKIVRVSTIADHTDRYRDIVNFKYWRTRCEVEQEQNTVEARELLYQAKQKADDADVYESRRLFEESWQRWAQIFKDYPDMLEDVTADDLTEDVESYLKLLNNLGEPLPRDFPLRKLMEVHNKADRLPPESELSVPSKDPERGAESNDAEIPPPPSPEIPLPPGPEPDDSGAATSSPLDPADTTDEAKIPPPPAP